MSYIDGMRSRIPSTQSLVTFEAVARRGSFTLAAQDLSLTQSAVSHQIQQLEQLLDVPLFRRQPRQLDLTAAGQSLLVRIGPALDAIEAVTLELASSKGEGGVIELGVVPTFATRWLIPRMSSFLKSHPGITLNLSMRLLPFDFSTTALDAAIHYGLPDWSGAQSQYLMGEDSIVVCSPELLAQGALREPSDVLGYTLIHQSTRPTAWRDWLALNEVVDARSQAGPKYELFSMISQAVKAGLGIAVLPRFLVAEELADGSLVAPFNTALTSGFAYYLVWPSHRTNWRPLQLFRDWLLAEK